MWNHRVVEKDGILGIHEVYYVGGKPTGVTVHPVAISEESIEDLEETILRIRNCLQEDVLQYEDILGDLK